MGKELIRMRRELEQKQKELEQSWIDYVKERGEVDLKGYCVSLIDTFAERMSKMYYRDGNIIFVDTNGNEYSFLLCRGERTIKDMEFAVFGCV